MAGITLRTARQVVPMIYAYTTPEIARHNGWTKIGYTEQSVDKRLKQQTHTADVLFHEMDSPCLLLPQGVGDGGIQLHPAPVHAEILKIPPGLLPIQMEPLVFAVVLHVQLSLA